MRGVALALLLLLLLPVSVWAAQTTQSVDFPTALSGTAIRLSMKLSEFDSSWRRVTVTGAQDLASSYAAMSGIPVGTHYTRGDTVTIAGETFLIAYSPPPNNAAMGLMIFGRGGGAVEDVTAETSFALSLLNVRTISSLSDIRPFDLATELAAFAEATSRLQSMMEARASTGVVEGEDDPSLSNLKNVALAAQMFMADYDDKIPPVETAEAFRKALEEYVPSNDVFQDPDTGELYSVNASLQGRSLAQIEDPAATVLVYQQTPRADGSRDVGFLDGHVKRVSDEEWQKLKAGSGIE
ncbi:MAG: hypothetical protein ACE149_09645 [Armatimonadota bacterium]